MEYKVLEDITLPGDVLWLGLGKGESYPETVQLSKRSVLVDGEIEPDVVARLWSRGAIEPVDMKAEKARQNKKGRLNKKTKEK